MSASPGVTSRGCSREFIFCVLYRLLKYVEDKKTKVCMPFPRSEVLEWISLATRDCGQDSSLMVSLGGTLFNVRDKATYWTTPEQFFTWWKNNVERKSKFQSLILDSQYEGSDHSLAQRALYCKSVIALTSNIKSFLHRNRLHSKQLLTPVPLPPPYEMNKTLSPVPKNAFLSKSTTN